jgi:hypothetical protein
MLHDPDMAVVGQCIDVLPTSQGTNLFERHVAFPRWNSFIAMACVLLCEISFMCG